MRKYILTLTLCVLCFAGSTTSAASQKESSNSDSDIAKVSSIENGLSYDENGRLASYHLVFPSGDMAKNCPAAKSTSKHYGIKQTALQGDALELVFPDYNATDEDAPCMAACLERGAEASIAGYPMPHRRFNASDTDTDFDQWHSAECSSVEVCLMNYHDEEYEIENYWVPPNGEPRLNQAMKYGEKHTRCFMSFLGHEFIVKATRDGSTVAEYTIEFPIILPFGKQPRNNLNIDGGQFDQQIRGTLKQEWQKKDVPQRTFSPLGFSKGKLPNDVFAAMGAFHYNNRNHKSREEWRGKGVFVNWWESDVYLIQIPWTIKDIWQERLSTLVSEWVGVPVEQTVMYGLRQYESGARLLTHVDRLNTHVVSLIINIAQGNLSQDWPVEVFDHHGSLHEVVMEPGDIVYYESAKNLHIRNRALMGENSYYTNLFTHYRPIGGGDEWYKDPTEVGREPLLEVKGVCHAPSEVVSKDTEHLGYGRVKCDDPRLGKNISPSLFVVKSADDLIEWWERTTPAGSVIEMDASFDDEDDDDGYDDDDFEDFEDDDDFEPEDGKDEL